MQLCFPWIFCVKITTSDIWDFRYSSQTQLPTNALIKYAFLKLFWKKQNESLFKTISRSSFSSACSLWIWACIRVIFCLKIKNLCFYNDTLRYDGMIFSENTAIKIVNEVVMKRKWCADFSERKVLKVIFTCIEFSNAFYLPQQCMNLCRMVNLHKIILIRNWEIEGWTCHKLSKLVF